MSREERIKQHIDTLMEMKEAMLKSDDWENLTRLIDACVAGGMALQASLDDGKYVSMKKIGEIISEMERALLEEDCNDIQFPQVQAFNDGIQKAIGILEKHTSGKENE